MIILITQNWGAQESVVAFIIQATELNTECFITTNGLTT
jgi:hypothetical protein